MGFKSDLEQFKCINLAPKKPLEAFEMGFKSYLKQFKCINLASNSLRTFFFLIYIYDWSGIMRTSICQLVFIWKFPSLSSVWLLFVLPLLKKWGLNNFIKCYKHFHSFYNSYLKILPIFGQFYRYLDRLPITDWAI